MLINSYFSQMAGKKVVGDGTTNVMQLFIFNEENSEQFLIFSFMWGSVYLDVWFEFLFCLGSKAERFENLRGVKKWETRKEFLGLNANGVEVVTGQ